MMIEWIILGVVLAGTGVTAYSQYEQGRTAKAQAEQQAKAEAAWNKYNADVGKQQAAYVTKQAALEEEATAKFALSEVAKQKRQAKQVLSRQRALIGASGVTMEGSPLLTAEDTAGQLALEEANVLGQIEVEGAARQEELKQRIYGYKSQSILDTFKSDVARNSAWGVGKGAGLAAGATLLSGAGQAGYMAYQMDLFPDSWKAKKGK